MAVMSLPNRVTLSPSTREMVAKAKEKGAAYVERTVEAGMQYHGLGVSR